MGTAVRRMCFQLREPALVLSGVCRFSGAGGLWGCARNGIYNSEGGYFPGAAGDLVLELDGIVQKA